jgi:hypothetical protein
MRRLNQTDKGDSPSRHPLLPYGLVKMPVVDEEIVGFEPEEG